jgi:hypothetical protein
MTQTKLMYGLILSSRCYLKILTDFPAISAHLDKTGNFVRLLARIDKFQP